MLPLVLAQAPSRRRGPAGASQGQISAHCPGSREKVGASAPAFGTHLELRMVFPCEPKPAVDAGPGLFRLLTPHH